VGQVIVIELRIGPSDSASIMETYGGGALFDVLEPLGSGDQYPVIASDTAWIRVRAQDGLVGWIDIMDVNVN